MTLVVAHRGASVQAPENTMESFRLGAAVGADAIELDVHSTSDGHLAVIHDETVDRTTYLNYGVNRDEIPVLLASGYFLRYSKEGTNALVFDADPKTPVTLSGFVWEGNTERLLKGTSYVIDESSGSGHVILFAEDPFFRGMTRSMTRPFFNSILFNGVF